MVNEIVEETESTQENMIENTPGNIDVSNVPSSHDMVTETIIKVLHMTNDNGFGNANKIVGATKKMHMEKRDKGSISNAQKFNTLQGRWFGENSEEVHENNAEMAIKRGSIVRIDTCSRSPFFYVYTVFCDNGSKKWFPSHNFPQWPPTDVYEKGVCLALREVNVLLERNGKKSVMWKKYIIDGENVQKSYKLVSMKEVKLLEFNVTC